VYVNFSRSFWCLQFSTTEQPLVMVISFVIFSPYFFLT
jgi:hypothetical protein